MISRTIRYSSNYNQNMISELKHPNISNSLISHYNVLTSSYTSNYCCKGSYFLWYIIYHVVKNRFFYFIFQIGNTNLMDVFLETWDISTLSISYKCIRINTNMKLRNSTNFLCAFLWIHNYNMKIRVDINVT